MVITFFVQLKKSRITVTVNSHIKTNTYLWKLFHFQSCWSSKIFLKATLSMCSYLNFLKDSPRDRPGNPFQMTMRSSIASCLKVRVLQWWLRSRPERLSSLTSTIVARLSQGTATQPLLRISRPSSLLLSDLTTAIKGVNVTHFTPFS